MTPPRRDATIFDNVEEEESEQGQILRLSPSALTIFAKCPFQFYALYILRIRQPLNHALFFGNIFDDTMNYNYKDKITSEKDLPRDVVTDFFVTKFDSEKQRVGSWEDKKPKDLREVGAKGVSAFMEEVTPDVHPVEVQTRLSMTFQENNLVLVGYPDFIERGGVIGDNKTAGKSKRQEEIDRAYQPLIYSLFKDQTSEAPREVRYDVLVKTKKPKIQQIRTTVTGEDRRNGLKYISNTVALINSMKQTQNFPPMGYRGPATWVCSYCAAADLCRKTWGTKVESRIPDVVPVSGETIDKANEGANKKEEA